MTDLDAYRVCSSIAIRRKSYFLGGGIEIPEAISELWLRWRADHDAGRSARFAFYALDVMRDKFGRKHKPRIKSLPIQNNDAVIYEDKDTHLVIEDARTIEGGRFARLIDAYINNHGEQKAMAVTLGVSGPAVSQQMKRLRNSVGPMEVRP